MPTSAPLSPFSIMAKPTCGVCNLACGYCYYLGKTKLYPETSHFQMADEVLATFTEQYQVLLPPGEAVFTWQGGEPLLAGLDFYKRALELQEKHRQPGKQPVNVLQTNGTLIDKPWAEFLGQNKFLVGLSLDGPAAVHNQNRIDAAGKGSFARAWQGLELLRENGVQFNVLVTLNAANVSLGADLYRFFRDQGLKWLQFIPILELDEKGQPQPYSCPPAEYGRFLCDTFSAWHQGDVGDVSVRIFESILYSMVRGHPSICCFAQSCADAHVLEWNGDLYACDHFVEKKWLIGNIMAEGLEQLLRKPKITEFAALKTDLPTTCQQCKYKQLCHGGCPKHRLPDQDGHLHNHYCQAYKQLFQHAAPHFTTIAKNLTTPHQRPQRNAPCPCGSGKKFKHCCGRKG